MSISQAYAKSAPAVKEIRPSEIIYQVYPSSFCDSNGDGIGDLQGIISKLDYIANVIHADAIWIPPIFPSPEGPEGDGGYAVSNRRGIDPRYGDMATFKTLLDEAHKRGLRIYIDDVLPHTSDEHEWFEKSRNREEPYTDFYVWHDGMVDADGNRQPPNNWLSVFGGGAWEWDETREQYYMHHFLKSQPSLNLNNKAVQDAVLDDMKFWLDMGVDGFRIDSIPYANYDPQLRDDPWLFEGGTEWADQRFDHSKCQPQTIELAQRIRALCDSYPEKKTTLGEVLSGRDGGKNAIAVAAEYAADEDGLDMCYTDIFRAIGHDMGHGFLKGVMQSLFDHFPHGGHCISIGNHDSPRTASRDMDSVPKHYRAKALRQLMRLKMVLPGSVSLYQGEELGLPNAKLNDDIPMNKVRDPVTWTRGVDRCRDICRTPMPWESGQKNAGFSTSDDPYLPVADDHYHRAVNKQLQDPGSMLNFMSALIKWRKAQPALIKGFGKVLDTQEPIIAILRQCGEQTMLSVFNFSDKQVMFKPSDLLDPQTLNDLGISKEEVMRLGAYDCDFRGARLLHNAITPGPQRKLTL